MYENKIENQREDERTISPEEIQEIIRLANILYFKSKVYEDTKWMGIKTAKNPLDMWVYQEIICKLNADIIIETGTYHGGSALFFANILDVLGKGKILSIDLNIPNSLPKHDRIEYIEGSSTSESVIEQVSEISKNSKSTMVILDSDHRASHKLLELSLYAKFVTKGNYLIAEDSCFDYYPAWPEFGEGPAIAVKQFMENNVNFEIDRTKEKHLITFSPKAFLKKIR